MPGLIFQPMRPGTGLSPVTLRSPALREREQGGEGRGGRGDLFPHDSIQLEYQSLMKMKTRKRQDRFRVSIFIHFPVMPWGAAAGCAGLRRNR